RDRRLGLRNRGPVRAEKRGRQATPCSFHLTATQGGTTQLPRWRQGTASNSRSLQAVESVSQRSQAPGEGVYGSQKPRHVYDHQGAEQETSQMVRETRRIRPPDPLPQGIRERQGGC